MGMVTASSRSVLAERSADRVALQERQQYEGIT